MHIGFFPGMSWKLCAFLSGFDRIRGIVEVGKGLRRPSSPAQCGYNSSRLFSGLSTQILNIWQVFFSYNENANRIESYSFGRNSKEEGETLKGSLEIIRAYRWKILYSLANLF